MMSMPPWGSQPPPPGTKPYGMQMNPPAYTPVPVRQTFTTYSQPQIPHYPQYTAVQPPAIIPVETPAKKAKVEWPASVRFYVQRSFDSSNMVPDVTRSEMETKLKEIISAATENDTLFTIDWDNLPLPQQLIRADRTRAAAVSWRPEAVQHENGTTGFQASNRELQSKKRKSQEVNGREDDASTPPPWRSTNTRTDFENRITQATPTKDSTAKATSKFQKNLEKRQKRFDGGYKSGYKRSASPESSTGPVVGRCQDLEKRYFRLTAAPDPNVVRPEHILKQTLELLKRKWRREGNYSFICDQFKSLRQDLTVQHIKNKFTVEVYEIHARIALEKGDLGEYNQCQTQLRALYAQNLGGNPMEFKAYRILYFIHTSNRTSLNDVLADLTTAEKEESAIKHALSVRSALALGNYHRFFRLYLDTPNMGAYLMDMFVVRERLVALSNICKAYKPDVKLRFITEELGFESDADAAQFICDNNGRDLLEERGDEIIFFTGKAGGIFESARVEAFRKIDIKGQI